MNLKNLATMSFMLFLVVFSSYAFSQMSSQVMYPDADITANVKAKIAADYSLSGSNIDVKTSNGVVTLAGNVNSNTQASTMTEIAQSTPGVKDVDTSNLVVTGSQQPMTDAYITAKIKGMFIQEKLFGDKDIAAMNIKVETNNGVVSLSGTVDNQEQAINAVKIAKKVNGVKEVKSTIKTLPANQ